MTVSHICKVCVRLCVCASNTNARQLIDLISFETISEANWSTAMTTDSIDVIDFMQSTCVISKYYDLRQLHGNCTFILRMNNEQFEQTIIGYKLPPPVRYANQNMIWTVCHWTRNALIWLWQRCAVIHWKEQNNILILVSNNTGDTRYSMPRIKLKPN